MMNAMITNPSPNPNPNYPFTIDSFPTFSSSSSISSPPHPRRKRSKRTHINKTPVALSPSGSSKVISKPKKRAKKPDPSAPKITQPCTECGKTFWSLKALFGHMRCHPERQWRGVNPPADLHRPAEVEMSEEENEIAECLIMLSNGSSRKDQSLCVRVSSTCQQPGDDDRHHKQFEYSSCEEVFGLNQALGVHRVTHKNVKGCFASTSNESELEDNQINEEKTIPGLGLGHKCGICFRVFSSGQALGGHMRCHSEKVEEPCINLNSVAADHEGCLDLNLPAPMDDNEDDDSYSYSSRPNLDLPVDV